MGEHDERFNPVAGKAPKALGGEPDNQVPARINALLTRINALAERDAADTAALQDFIARLSAKRSSDLPPVNGAMLDAIEPRVEAIAATLAQRNAAISQYGEIANVNWPALPAKAARAKTAKASKASKKAAAKAAKAHKAAAKAQAKADAKAKAKSKRR